MREHPLTVFDSLTIVHGLVKHVLKKCKPAEVRETIAQLRAVSSVFLAATMDVVRQPFLVDGRIARDNCTPLVVEGTRTRIESDHFLYNIVRINKDQLGLLTLDFSHDNPLHLPTTFVDQLLTLILAKDAVLIDGRYTMHDPLAVHVACKTVDEVRRHVVVAAAPCATGLASCVFLELQIALHDVFKNFCNFVQRMAEKNKFQALALFGGIVITLSYVHANPYCLCDLMLEHVEGARLGRFAEEHEQFVKLVEKMRQALPPEKRAFSARLKYPQCVF